MVLELRAEKPVLHSCMYDRTRFPARGFLGGQNGAAGELFLSDGARPHPKSKYLIQPGQQLTLRLPGGGGFQSPFSRQPARVLADVRQGYVSLEQARERYGVVVDPHTWTINEEETDQLRAKSAWE